MQVHMYQDGRTLPEDINMFDGTCMIKYLKEGTCQLTGSIQDEPRVIDGAMLPVKNDIQDDLIIPGRMGRSRVVVQQGLLNSPNK